MANPEHLEIFMSGDQDWSKWRSVNPEIKPDLSNGDLYGVVRADINLSRCNLSGTLFQNAYLRGANFSQSELQYANFSGASLEKTNFNLADISHAVFDNVQLQDADLVKVNAKSASFKEAVLGSALGSEITSRGARLCDANMENVDFSHASLDFVDLSHANLRNANFREVRLSRTGLYQLDLSSVKGLDTCFFLGPSFVDYQTLSQSEGLPIAFLRGIGLPDNYIDYIPSLFHGDAVQYYSCFISYATANEDFAKRLYADLQNNSVRCWFAPENMKAGRKLHHQIDEGIKLHDKLVLILSEESMASDWVQHEIKQTRKREKAEDRQKLFPIMVTPFEHIARWELFDPATVTDLADEVRSYFIPDFSDWKNYDSYQKAFGRLLRDLKQS